MNRPSLATVLAALLLGAPAAGRAAEPPKAAPEPTKAEAPAKAGKSPRKTSVRITSVIPADARYGELVTITGKGLNQGNAVVVGKFSPTIVEQTDTKIVFKAPTDPTQGQFETSLFVVTPGLPIAHWSTPLIFSKKARTVKVASVSGVVLEDSSSLSAAAPKRYEVSVHDTNKLHVFVTTKGGEVEARLSAVEASDADGLVRATYGGALNWKANVRDVVGKAKPEKLALTLSTDGSGVSYTLKVLRHTPGAANLPNDGAGTTTHRTR